MKKILVILAVAFILIQFFPIDKNNPTPTQRMDFLTIKETPESTAKLLRSGCYDCHSNETKYLWYANVQPIGWFLKNHIEEGRKELNFSTFATYDVKRQARKLDEAVEMIEKDEMPLDSYLLAHPEAQFTEAQKQELIQYFKLIGDDIRRTNNLPAETKN